MSKYTHVRRKAAAKADKLAKCPQDWQRLFDAECQRLEAMHLATLQRQKAGEAQDKRQPIKFAVDTSTAPSRSCSFSKLASQNGDAL